MALTKRQRDHLERRLREERARAARALDRYHSELGDPDPDASGDVPRISYQLADEGTDTFERELAAQQASRLSRELAEIDAALERLYRSPTRFGRDERTGRAIPFERLDVIPWARTRVDGP